MILALRTDKPEAELHLLSKEGAVLDRFAWQAHRELSETLFEKIELLLARHEQRLRSIEGIICYTGPGSFTGLRIGLAVANSLAYSNGLNSNILRDCLFRLLSSCRY